MRLNIPKNKTIQFQFAFLRSFASGPWNWNEWWFKEEKERIRLLDKECLCAWVFFFFLSLREYLFGQQHESSIFVIHSFVAFFFWPTILHRTHDLACVKTHEKRERERERKEKRRENNYSVIVTTTNQNTYTFIHTYGRIDTSISLLQIVRSRSRIRILHLERNKARPTNNACWSFCTLSITSSYQSQWISKGKTKNEWLIDRWEKNTHTHVRYERLMLL